MSDVFEHNRRAWDTLVRRKDAFAVPVRSEQLDQPLLALDARGWLDSDLRGKHVLCLAAGGGKQSILFAEAGAIVTVFDISSEMLALDRQVAGERGVAVRTVQGSMHDLSALAPASFDIVAQPVSTCYVPDVSVVYREVARVIRAHGIYVSQHKQPASLQAAERPERRGYVLGQPYYRTGPLPDTALSRLREAGTLEFLHRWEQLVGGLCRAGFVIEDLAEPCHADTNAVPGEFGHRSQYIAPYVRIKARRSGGRSDGPTIERIWTA